MARGPGKYDDECTELRERLGADGLLLVVVRGVKGSSFCAQLSSEDSLLLPKILRTIANQIEQSGGDA